MAETRPEPDDVPLHEPFALRWRYAFFGAVFALGYRVFGLRRGVIRRNLLRSFPQLDGAAREALRNDFVRRQGQTFAENDYSLRMTSDELRERVRVVDPAGVLLGEARPRRVLYVAGHQNNFEWVLLRLSIELGSDMVALYKPPKGEFAERYIRSRRTKFGTRMLPSKSITKELGTIRAARALGMVADQVPRTSPERHWTTFLHQPTAFFQGPERLGRALRATIVYISVRRLGRGRYELTLVPLTAAGEKLPEGEATERYARALERDIQADPAGWWWSHKRWKLEPPAEALSGS